MMSLTTISSIAREVAQLRTKAKADAERRAVPMPDVHRWSRAAAMYAAGHARVRELLDRALSREPKVEAKKPRPTLVERATSAPVVDPGAVLEARLAELRAVTPATAPKPAPAAAPARVLPGQAPSPKPTEKGVDNEVEAAERAARQRIASLAFDPLAHRL